MGFRPHVSCIEYPDVWSHAFAIVPITMARALETIVPATMAHMVSRAQPRTGDIILARSEGEALTAQEIKTIAMETAVKGEKLGTCDLKISQEREGGGQIWQVCFMLAIFHAIL